MALSPENQYKIWIDKLEQVLSLDVWNETQRKHIVSLKNAVKPIHYSDREQNESFNKNFLMPWWKEGIMMFDKITLIKRAGITNDLTITELAELPPAGDLPGGGIGGDPNCHCNTFWDFCLGDYRECKGNSNSSPCIASSIGCGLLLLRSCDGLCQLK